MALSTIKSYDWQKPTTLQTFAQTHLVIFISITSYFYVLSPFHAPCSVHCEAVGDIRSREVLKIHFSLNLPQNHCDCNPLRKWKYRDLTLMTRVCSASTEAAALSRSLISWSDDEQISIFFLILPSNRWAPTLMSVWNQWKGRGLWFFKPWPLLCIVCIETKKFCCKGQTFNILFNILWQTQIKYEKNVGDRET